MCIWVDNQFFLACIARRTAVVSKSQMSQSISQFDTKQDMHGKIFIVDTGYAFELRILYLFGSFVVSLLLIIAVTDMVIACSCCM